MRMLSASHLRRQANESHGSPHGQTLERTVLGPTEPAACSRDHVAKAGVKRTMFGSWPPFNARRSAGRGKRNETRRIRKFMQAEPRPRRRNISDLRMSACDFFRNPTSQMVRVPLGAGFTGRPLTASPALSCPPRGTSFAQRISSSYLGHWSKLWAPRQSTQTCAKLHPPPQPTGRLKAQQIF